MFPAVSNTDSQGRDSMTRIKRLTLAFALAGLVGGVAAAPATAQGATPAAAPAAKLAGAWEGPYTTDGPSGTMLLTVTRNASDWKVEVSLGGDAPPPGEPSEVTAAGNVLTWKQTFGEFDVAFKATLADDAAGIAGTLEAMQGGAYAGGGTFTLKRKM
jgi:hypothetical protein